MNAPYDDWSAQAEGLSSGGDSALALGASWQSTWTPRKALDDEGFDDERALFEPLRRAWCAAPSSPRAIAPDGAKAAARGADCVRRPSPSGVEQRDLDDWADGAVCAAGKTPPTRGDGGPEGGAAAPWRPAGARQETPRRDAVHAARFAAAAAGAPAPRRACAGAGGALTGGAPLRCAAPPNGCQGEDSILDAPTLPRAHYAFPAMWASFARAACFSHDGTGERR
ncbi:hypothetical protein M885DRAFT_539169 [Pelagophyceae sp. CCMP2097]|nr:hypothetical protein M885DRAFT_539169 [Pelagophyceae sp. CCMP2097]